MIRLFLGSSIRTALVEVACVADTGVVDAASSDSKLLVTDAVKGRVFASDEARTAGLFTIGAWASNAWDTCTGFSGGADIFLAYSYSVDNF
jgi:hypothetical protein